MLPLFEFIGWIARLLILLILLVLVIFGEAIMFSLFKYASLWRSLLASLLVNVTSTVLGFKIGAGLSLLNPLLSFLNPPISSPDLIGRWFLPADSGPFSNSRLPSMPLFLLVSWIISIIAEGGILMLMKRDAEPRKIWEITLVSNAVSYILLFGIYIGIVWNL